MAEISAGPSESGIFESITMPATMGLSGHDSALVGNGAISRHPGVDAAMRGRLAAPINRKVTAVGAGRRAGR